MSKPSERSRRFQAIGEELAGKPLTPKSKPKSRPESLVEYKAKANKTKADVVSRMQRDVDRELFEAFSANRIIYSRDSGHDRVNCVMVDCKVCDAGTPKYWITREGDVISILSMTDSHLFNVAKLLLRNHGMMQNQVPPRGVSQSLWRKEVAVPLIVQSKMYRAMVNELRRRNIKPPKLVPQDW